MTTRPKTVKELRAEIAKATRARHAAKASTPNRSPKKSGDGINVAALWAKAMKNDGKPLPRVEGE